MATSAMRALGAEERARGGAKRLENPMLWVATEQRGQRHAECGNCSTDCAKGAERRSHSADSTQWHSALRPKQSHQRRRDEVRY